MNKPTPQAIPFVDLKAQYARLKDDIDARIRTVLEHGRFILGPEVSELEHALAESSGAKHVVTCSSGTDALLMALMVEGIGPGDAVFVPGFTFAATAEVVVRLGACPVFVDVDERSFAIDPDDLVRKIAELAASGAARPRAVIAVDLFGLPADYGALRAICADHDMFLLADGAQSFGASSGDGRVGTLAPATAVSFYPAKPLGGYGDGGAVFTNEEDKADSYRSIRAHGAGNGKYDTVRIGLNARLDTLQAAILLTKLPVLAEEIEARERLAQFYDTRLGNLVDTPRRVAGGQSAWAQYSVLLDRRDEVAAALKRQGIPTAIYYPHPLHRLPAYEAFGGGPGSLPVSESVCRRVLSLPMHPYMDGATAERICDEVAAAVVG